MFTRAMNKKTIAKTLHSMQNGKVVTPWQLSSLATDGSGVTTLLSSSASANYMPSRYNLIYKSNDLYYVWNTLSGAVATLNEEILGLLFCGEIGHLKSAVIENLVKNRIVVPSSFDEYEYVLNRSNKILNEESPQDLHFVIAPTLHCNYRCEYCFELSRTSFSDMTEDVSSKVCNFVKNCVDRNCNLRCLHITWFGGEPLLRADIIEKLSNSFVEFCSLRNIDYRATLITNGRYLDARVAEKLVKIGIKRIQISLDGTMESYCRAKRASRSDYLTTIANVGNAARKGLPIVLRINIRDNDFSSAYQLADLFFAKMALGGMVKLYPAFVNEGDLKKRRDLYAGFVLEDKRFARYVYDKYSEESYYNKLSFAHGVACSLSCKSNFCIGPMGELYKCEHHFGQKDFIVGNISDVGCNDKSFLPTYERSVKASMYKEQCKECSVFPICLGGCPNSNLLNDQAFDCKDYIKYLVECQMRRIIK